MKTQTEDHAQQQAKAQLESIREMIAALANSEGDAHDEARQTIEEDPLSIQVRGGWHSPGESSMEKPIEFEILLCTGGPAVRIIGELSEYMEPTSVTLQHQDWGTPWIELELSNEEEEDVLAFASCFYFGE